MAPTVVSLPGIGVFEEAAVGRIVMELLFRVGGSLVGGFSVSCVHTLLASLVHRQGYNCIHIVTLYPSVTLACWSANNVVFGFVTSG